MGSDFEKFEPPPTPTPTPTLHSTPTPSPTPTPTPTLHSYAISHTHSNTHTPLLCPLPHPLLHPNSTPTPSPTHTPTPTLLSYALSHTHSYTHTPLLGPLPHPLLHPHSTPLPSPTPTLHALSHTHSYTHTPLLRPLPHTLQHPHSTPTPSPTPTPTPTLHSHALSHSHSYTHTPLPHPLLHPHSTPTPSPTPTLTPTLHSYAHSHTHLHIHTHSHTNDHSHTACHHFKQILMMNGKEQRHTGVQWEETHFQSGEWMKTNGSKLERNKRVKKRRRTGKESLHQHHPRERASSRSSSRTMSPKDNKPKKTQKDSMTLLPCFYFVELSHSQAETDTAVWDLHETLTLHQTQHRDAALIVVGDFNPKSALPNFHQHITCPTRGERTLDHCYTPFKNSYKVQSRPPFGKSDYAAIFLMPVYKQRLKQKAPFQREVVCWTDKLVAALQDALDDTDWDMFRRSSDDVRMFTEVVVGFIRKLADDTGQKTTIRTFPNQKPRVDTTICDALRSHSTAYNTGITTRDMDKYKAEGCNSATGEN
ncbi:hypothetical protein C0J50_21058 [Silurus asotus]|uniref:Uncharacterized protein n=1 Tax=Silurus asotus TaxID=30991 RepID=A0AAD5ANA6_SILAS|nr:hypothetical protein C0J50_21058 [Silurus asotus]